MLKKWIAALLILAGAALAAYPSARDALDRREQERLMEEWRQSLLAVAETPPEEGEEPTDTGGPAASPALPAVDGEPDETPGATPSPQNIEGVLRIGAIGFEQPILTGATAKNLAVSVASIRGTGRPGEVGNYAVAGHRSRPYGKNFNRLDELKAGDELTVETAGGVYTYVVSQKLYVAPDEVWVLEGNGRDREITLVTCHPMDRPTQRLIVKGVLKDG